MIQYSDRAAFFATYHQHQTWSFPDSVIYYISKNPSSSKCYQKIIKSCKHFFIKNPIVVTPKINAGNRNFGWRTFLTHHRVYLNNFLSKIWITNRVNIDELNPSGQTSFSFITSKIYKCDAKELDIWRQNISFKVLKLLASKCERIMLFKLVVINEDGSVVLLEEIVEMLSTVKHFEYDLVDTSRNTISSKTGRALIKIPHFSNTDYFAVRHLPENFDIDSFYGYIKMNKKTKFFLHFCHALSEAYTNRLRTIVNEIIAMENHDFKTPILEFSGIGLATLQALLNLFMRN